MKIYTKTGDKGETGLVGGRRLGKDSVRIHAYGDVDELNAVLGLCRALNKDPGIEEMLHLLQRELFQLGADLATPLDSKVPVPRIREKQVTRLEQWIDGIEVKVGPLQHFILPGGTPLAAQLHVARTVCRRAERSVTELQREEKIGDTAVKYINRFSDFLFMAARLANMLGGETEEQWKADLL